ncbi:tryptase-like protein [Aphelenchoides avenae]|nr:tryptase-like protein [Aphelenchus avenae]
MVKKVFTGPHWVKTHEPDIWVDDIAILEMEELIEFDDYAQPICLPKSFRERPGDPGYFVGWGRRNIVPEPHNKTVDYEGGNPVANENMVTFRKSSHCDTDNGSDVAFLHREDYICAGQYMRLAHKGDSGGPLMVNRKGTWFQVGTNSAGRRADGRGQGMFARVTSYCKWIKDVTKGDVTCVKL